MAMTMKYYLGPFSELPGIGSLEASSIRGSRLLSTIVSASNQSATSYWVMFQINSFPNDSEYIGFQC